MDFFLVTMQVTFRKKKREFDLKINGIKLVSIMVVLSGIILPTILYISGEIGNLPGTHISWKWIFIGFIKIGIPAIFSIYMFRLYSQQEKHFLMDAKHLFAWQFLFMVISKIMDLYSLEVAEGDVSALAGIQYLPLMKIRWIFIVLAVLPVFLFFIHIYSRVWTIKLQSKEIFLKEDASIEQRGEFTKKFELFIDLAFIALSMLYIGLVPHYDYLKVFTLLVIFPLISLGIYTFNDLRKHERLPELNSFLIMIGYMIYFSSILLRIFITDLEISYFFEGIEGISYYFMGIAFVIRPKYGYAVQKP